MLSLIMPAYNEEKRIRATLADYAAWLNGREAEIIVVLNGCRDNTLGVVREIQNKYPSVIKCAEFEGSGKGFAVREGFKMAAGELIGFVDADGSIVSGEFDKLIGEMGNGGAAVASRLLKESRVIGRSFFRGLFSRIFSSIIRRTLNLPVRDVQCGAKLFRREDIKGILPAWRVDNMAFDAELLYLLARKGCAIKEVPIVWTDKTGSPTLGSPGKFFKNSLRMLVSLLKIRFSNLKSKKY